MLYVEEEVFKPIWHEKIDYRSIKNKELQRLIAMAGALGYPVDWVYKRLERAQAEDQDARYTREERYYQNILKGFMLARTRKSRRKILKRLERFGLTIVYERNNFWEKLTRSKSKPHLARIYELTKEQTQLYKENNQKKFWKPYTRYDNMVMACIQRLKKSVEKVCGSDEEVREIAKARAALNDCTEDGIYNLDKQACVHATFYRPEQDEDGCYVVESLATSSDLINPRNTFHVAIGSHVVSHDEGGWDNTPYVLIMPLKDMIEKNGKPLGMSLVDTFFEMGLNEDLHLPKSTHLVKPATGELPDDIDFVTYGNLTLYRASGFSEKVRKRHERTARKPLSDAEIAIRSKFSATSGSYGALYFLGFQSHLCESDTSEAENIRRLAEKIDVFGSARKDLHAALSLFGPYRSVGERVMALSDVLRLLAWGIENKYGIKASEALFPPRPDKPPKKYESLDNQQSPSDKIKATENLKDDAERIYWERLDGLSFPTVPEFFKSELFATSLNPASPKEKEVFGAWAERTQQRVDLLRKIKKQISETKKRKTSEPDR